MNLLIRADASAGIGTGHVMRMLALAQAWVDRGQKTEVRGQSLEGAVERKPSSVLFISAILPEALEQRLIDEGFQVMRIAAEPGSEDDIYQTLGLAQSNSQSDQFTNQPIAESTNHPHWVVLDGYAFDLNYQRAIRAAGFKLLVVDDYNHLPEYECDILLNQNIGAEAYRYRVNDDACQLTGPCYALLRREFREVELNRISAPTISAFRLLVTMGGADYHHMTRSILDAVENLPGEPLHIRAVMGVAYRNLEGLSESVARSRHHVELMTDVENMSDLMLSTDLAISAAGSTCLELMSLGVPLAILMIADNQRDVALAMIDLGLAVNLGWYKDWNADDARQRITALIRDANMREAMARRGQAVVNRSGAMAVVASMQVNKRT